MEKSDYAPTAVGCWRRNHPVVANLWQSSISQAYQITSGNKLRQFSLKLMNRVLVTKKELQIFGIENDDKCVKCNNNDSIQHTFLECPEFSPLEVLLGYVPRGLIGYPLIRRKNCASFSCKSNITSVHVK